MSKVKIVFLTALPIVALMGLLLLPPVVQAAATTTEELGTTPIVIPPDQFYLAKILKIEPHPESSDILGGTLKTATVLILSGPDKNKQITIDFGGDFANEGAEKMSPGNYAVIMKTQPGGETSYYLVDRFRLPGLAIVALFFLLVVGSLGGGRGFAALLGLTVSILIVTLLIVPAILNGYNPLLVGFLGTALIACLSLYLAHGYNKRTTTALWSTLITLAIAFGLSLFSVWGIGLFGLGSEEARILSLNLETAINLQGLLVVAIIIGTLGVLDDTTINQTHIVYELAEANPKFTRKELYARSLKIGKEHIASLVNTLFLAYIGAFLPLFIALSLVNEPLWVTVNREMIGEEIVRSIMGSIALVLAVPISSFLAARSVKKDNLSSNEHGN